ncbi:MAG: glutathione S-transferase family protein [Deltaproteobacteria bacterium]|nr:glutathione S-transferase family protein [Deltaproteobacteria bacterium]
MTRRYRLYGSSLSPFSLKVEALLRHARLPYAFLPADGPRRLALSTQALQQAVVRGLRAPTYPPIGHLRELPLVPYVFTPRDEILWDSTSIGFWLDEHPQRLPEPARLLPDDPATRLACELLDELFDELGLYVLHHVRWVLSGATTRAVSVLAEEYAPVLTRPIARLAAQAFARRQVRRLPYLFSVAPAGHRTSGVSRELQPPSRPGFPPTHALLEQLFDALLDASEAALSSTPYLLGERFTLADASLYGMMESIRRIDPAGAQRMRERAPTLATWLEKIADSTGRRGGALGLHDGLSPLLDLVVTGLVPLLKQNAEAWERASSRGEARRRSQRAFDRGRALYDGELQGHAFRSVAKGSRVDVWQRLKRRAHDLPRHAGDELWTAAPGLATAFGRDA